MSLAHGRHTLAIPGPSIMPDRVLQAMHRAAPNIYTGELIDMTYGLVPDLKAVARTEHNVAMYIGNGHATWEASLANTHSRGDLVLVPSNGHFGFGWANHARTMGLEAEFMDFGKDTPMDPDAIEARLRQDTEHRIKSVLAVHVDTSTSLRADIKAIRAALDATGHPALLMADCMASLGCDRFEMDAWGVDVTMAGCQKGLMTPPGMCFVWFNDRAAEARKTADLATGYWDWTNRADPEGYWQLWNGTAPTHHLYGLREALTMIVHEEGIEKVWARHSTFARALWAACDVWALGGALAFSVADPVHRSNAVTSLRLPDPMGTKLRGYMENQLGVTLGIGLGMDDPDAAFRVGHMGHMTAHGMMGTLGAMEAGMAALGLPYGNGALAAAAEVIAEG